ncbi:hypothetical protein I633_22251 (plasmid) [Alteromonas mediterranea 615]|jgi:hypothetical protein|uniref:Uncharacterized protein n=1 Tax=Alteromonas mediterranea 615 TaxID=1300253 RepID=S5ASN1_9ALTE|nr:hypothetical protein I633_22251 [Alteromonas mediterranea 615]|tara:strand:- start:946 stop:1608 length:663 start_codon:yes stop_codon:yes gene_type:complete
MALFDKTKQVDSVEELTPAQKAHIVHTLNYTPRNSNLRFYRRKFGITNQVVSDLSKYSNVKDVVKKDENRYSPNWDNDDVIFHPDADRIEVISIDNDKEYDSVNEGCHYKWDEADCYQMFSSLLDRALEMIRDSAVDQETFNEGLDYLVSDVNKAFCKSVGIDHEELVLGALHYKDLHDDERIQYELSQKDNKADALESADVVCIDDYVAELKQQAAFDF